MRGSELIRSHCITRVWVILSSVINKGRSSSIKGEHVEKCSKLLTRAGLAV